MNIGIFAHVDAGKTTVTEHLLYEAGVINHIGRVDTGNTMTDKMSIEKKRGISIQSTPISFDYKDIKFNLIDTPGHVEFVAEVERAMSVLDVAILVVSAKEGIQSHTLVLYQSLRKMNIPLLIFVNKIDRLGVDIDQVTQEIKRELTSHCIGMQTVDIENMTISSDLMSEHVLEDLSLYDDHLLELLLTDEKIEASLVQESLRRQVIHGLIPICYGSALKGIGILDLLDTLVDYMPTCVLEKDGEVSGVVFKITRDKHDKREIYIRLYSGTIRSRGYLLDEKISFIKAMRHGKLEYVKEAYGNDIVLVMGLDYLKVGDLIGNPLNYQKVSIGTPTLRTKINAEDKHELALVVDRLAEADPFLNYELEVSSKDLYLTLFGDIQMEILTQLIKERHDMDVWFDQPDVIYKEMPISKGHHIMHMYKDSPFVATIGIQVEPYDGLLITSQVPTGHVNQNFQNGILDGIKYAMKEGLKGWALDNIKVTITEGAFNSVDSTPSDFRNLSPMVFMKALEEAGTSCLWPLNEFHIKIKHEYYGKIMADLVTMGAEGIDLSEEDDKYLIKGLLPIETSYDYEKRFISSTSGSGLISQKFHGYVKTSRVKSRDRLTVNPLNQTKYIMNKQRVF